MRVIPFDQLNGHTIRQAEQESIREFVWDNRDKLTGDVLDYGCGRPGTCRVPEPYRGIVEGVGGRYNGWEPGDGPFYKYLTYPHFFDTVLCTQAIQYVSYTSQIISNFMMMTKPGGYLVLTYPTTWPELKEEGMHEVYRITSEGVNELVNDNGFEVLSNEPRVKLDIPGFPLMTGYGLVARRR